VEYNDLMKGRQGGGGHLEAYFLSLSALVAKNTPATPAVVFADCHLNKPNIHTHTRIHTHAHTDSAYICQTFITLVYTSVYSHTYIHTRMYTHVYWRMYIHTRVYTHVYKQSYIHTYIHTRIYTHAYTHTCIHTRIYTHVYTHKYPPKDGEIALWSATNRWYVVKYVSQKRNQSNSKDRWYNILVTFIFKFNCGQYETKIWLLSNLSNCEFTTRQY